MKHTHQDRQVSILDHSYYHSINTLPSYHIQHKLIKKSNEENSIKIYVIHIDEHLNFLKLEQ
jgi:hypothetical protein